MAMTFLNFVHDNPRVHVSTMGNVCVSIYFGEAGRLILTGDGADSARALAADLIAAAEQVERQRPGPALSAAPTTAIPADPREISDAVNEGMPI
jgi:hypothetical protein